MSKTTPTQRSLKLLRDIGFHCAITERWNSHVKIRQDLFGFIDLLAIDKNMIAVQTTSSDNVSARVKKIVELESARIWLEAGHRIIVHGWSKRGAVGKVKRWRVRSLGHLPEGVG